MNALLFAGQGSQKPGMGAELASLSAGASKVFETASSALGCDLLALCRDGSAEELAATEVAQPAIMAVSLAAFAALTEKGCRLRPLRDIRWANMPQWWRAGCSRQKMALR